MSVHFQVATFEGPLDLLLQLVEREELGISEVSLARVTDQFLEYVNTHPGITIDELADFLVVASRLVQLKARALVPHIELEDEEGIDLAAQLKRYQVFVEYSRKVNALWHSEALEVGRIRPVQTVVVFSPPAGVHSGALEEVMWRIVSRLDPLRRIPQVRAERLVSVQEKMVDIVQRIQRGAKLSFRECIGTDFSKPQQVATFIAILELVKQGYVRVHQPGAYSDFAVESHPSAPASEMASEPEVL